MHERGGWDGRWSGGQVWGGKVSPQGPEQRVGREDGGLRGLGAGLELE